MSSNVKNISNINLGAFFVMAFGDYDHICYLQDSQIKIFIVEVETQQTLPIFHTIFPGKSFDN